MEEKKREEKRGVFHCLVGEKIGRKNWEKFGEVREFSLRAHNFFPARIRWKTSEQLWRGRAWSQNTYLPSLFHIDFYFILFICDFTIENTFNKDRVYYPCFTPTNKSVTRHFFKLYFTLQNHLIHKQLFLLKTMKTKKIKKTRSNIDLKEREPDGGCASTQPPPKQPHLTF